MRVDKFTLAKMNKRQVLEVIWNTGPISKSEIARATSLSIPTVTKIMNTMEMDHLIRICGWQNSTGGKRAQLYELNRNSFFSVGVDVGKLNIKVLTMNLHGGTLHIQTLPTRETLPAKRLINRIAELIEECIAHETKTGKSLLGIGIGVPGILDGETGTVLFSPNFGWEQVNLVELLRKKLKSKDTYIKIENSNRTLALGEYYFGAGKNSEYMVCINLGYGVGSAIIHRGEFYMGSSHTSGELGHITVDKDGALCTCGNYGCLEAMASGNAIAQQAKILISNGDAMALSSYFKGNIRDLEAKDIFFAARNGIPEAYEIVVSASEYIGIGIASYINIFDPEVIVLAGGMSNEAFLREKVQEIVTIRQMSSSGRRVKITTAQLGANATAIGAATLMLKRLIETGGCLDLEDST